MTDQSLLEFPCEYTLKAIGPDAATFRRAARQIVERHAGQLPDESVRARPSRGGAYLAISFTFRADSRAQMDALYRELSAHESVLLAL